MCFPQNSRRLEVKQGIRNVASREICNYCPEGVGPSGHGEVFENLPAFLLLMAPLSLLFRMFECRC